MPNIAPPRTRGEVIGRGGRWLAEWSLRLLLIVGALWVIDYILSQAWVVVLPILFATIVSTVLWPVSGWLQRHRLPPAAAALTTMIGAFLIVAGIIAGIVPSVMNQIGPLVDKSTEGLGRIRDWLTGPPLDIDPEQIDDAVHAVTQKMQSSASTIANGVFSGVTTAGEMVVTVLLIIVLTFFCIKDGPRFIPWLHRTAGSPTSAHVEEVLVRMWSTLSGFMRAQAIVAFIDAVLIGIGLVILGVPLAGVLAVITFFGGFIPIVGAVVAGALAVLVALVASGFVKALIVLAMILVIQQLEGNVFSPMLQGRSMDLHPAIILLAVTAGGSLWGIVGAFLAVPLAAMIAVLMRYADEQIQLRSPGGLHAEVVSADSDDAAPRTTGGGEHRWLGALRRMLGMGPRAESGEGNADDPSPRASATGGGPSGAGSTRGSGPDASHGRSSAAAPDEGRHRTDGSSDPPAAPER